MLGIGRLNVKYYGEEMLGIKEKNNSLELFQC